MKLFELFDANNPSHQQMMQDIDAFTASPHSNLKPETVNFLTSHAPHTKSMRLYRVLFNDSLKSLASGLEVTENQMQHGTKCVHVANRVSSWSKTKSIVEKMAVENSDLGRYAVVLMADVLGSQIVLDTTQLSKSDLQHIYLFDQDEVIVNAGKVPCVILSITDNEN